MTTRGFLLGVLVGGVVGAAMGMLFAPLDGASTRNKISETAKNAAGKVSGAAGNVKEKVMHRREAIEQSI